MFERKVCYNRPCDKPCPIAGNEAQAKAVDYVLAHSPIIPGEQLSEEEFNGLVNWGVEEHGVQGSRDIVAEAALLGLQGECKSRISPQ